MNYLQSLVRQKQARENYEKDENLKKELIFKINSLVSLYDGHFLTELDKFIKEYEEINSKR